MIELRSDVGGGKTTIVQGIAAGMGAVADVPSPTFTLNRVYPAERGLSLHHFDLYRLSGHDTVSEEFNEVLGDPDAVVVIEWAEQGAVHLPTDRLQITLTPDKEPEVRHITIAALGPKSQRVVQGLDK